MRIGISSCLLGERVRYDGKHKRHSVIVDELLPCVEVISVCPELELGMGVPRPPLKLVTDDTAVEIRMITWQGERIDFTDSMDEFAIKHLRYATVRTSAGISSNPDLRVAVQATCQYLTLADDEVRDQSFGLYAATIRRVWPSLPVTDETHLSSRTSISDTSLERAFTSIDAGSATTPT